MTDKNFIRLISILHRKNMAYLNSKLKIYDLTTSQVHILLYMSKHSGSSQEEISNYFSIDKASTARTIDSLIKKGYIIKKKNLEDKRAYKLFLTDFALKQNDEILDMFNRWNNAIKADLSSDELDNTYKCLQKMSENMENNISEGGIICGES